MSRQYLSQHMDIMQMQSNQAHNVSKINYAYPFKLT